MADVAEGLRGGRAAWARHDDRASAVRRALRESAPGDLIVLLGKGDERYQEVDGVRHPYSDRETARAALSELEREGAAPATPAAPAAAPAPASGAQVSVERVIEALGPPRVGPAAPVFAGVDTDSRAVRRGSLFVGVRGERFDGSAFAEGAVRAGAGAAVAEREPPAGLPPGAGWWTVADGLDALQRLAGAHRRAARARVACVTGSNGKTGTKELVASVLAARFEVARTRGNLNNQVGLPLSLLDLEPRHDWGVFEIGTNRPGEIARLTELARPEIGVITNVAPSHLEGLGSLEGVLREKTALAAGLAPGGTLVFGGDDPLLAGAVGAFRCRRVSFGLDPANDVHPEGRELDGEGRPVFRAADLGEVRLRLVGVPNLLNALAAVAVGRVAGLSPGEIRAGLEAAEPLRLRLEVARAGGVTVIQDCYNANPGSMRRGVETLRALGGGRSRVAVLGGMRELGREAEALHYALGRDLAADPLDLLVVYGEEAVPLARGYQSATDAPVHLARDGAAVAELLRTRVSAPAAVLFKASRGPALETAAEAYLEGLRVDARRRAGGNGG
jgi:UDP-N-acetylmuramoyl-tripeptide--D-alanyl-D-alanine ligase